MTRRTKKILDKIPEHLKIEKAIQVNLTPAGNSAHGLVHAKFAGAKNAFIVICSEKTPNAELEERAIIKY